MFNFKESCSFLMTLFAWISDGKARGRVTTDKNLTGSLNEKQIFIFSLSLWDSFALKLQHFQRPLVKKTPHLCISYEDSSLR